LLNLGIFALTDGGLAVFTLVGATYAFFNF